MATVKCAHPACSCQVTDKNYCSDRCKAASQDEPKCLCDHPGCKGHH